MNIEDGMGFWNNVMYHGKKNISGYTNKKRRPRWFF